MLSESWVTLCPHSRWLDLPLQCHYSAPWDNLAGFVHATQGRELWGPVTPILADILHRSPATQGWVQEREHGVLWLSGLHLREKEMWDSLFPPPDAPTHCPCDTSSACGRGWGRISFSSQLVSQFSLHPFQLLFFPKPLESWLRMRTIRSPNRDGYKHVFPNSFSSHVLVFWNPKTEKEPLPSRHYAVSCTLWGKEYRTPLSLPRWGGGSWRGEGVG